MATLAGLSAGVFFCGDLREKRWTCGVLLVASCAQDQRVGQNELLSGGIFRVAELRTVARLTSNGVVARSVQNLRNIVVAGFTGGMSGVCDRFRPNLSQSALPEMPVPSEACWHKRLTGDREEPYRGHKNHGEPKKVSSLFQPRPPLHERFAG